MALQPCKTPKCFENIELCPTRRTFQKKTLSCSPARRTALAVAPSTDRIVSLSAKAKKVGGLYLALGGVAVRPTDAVDAKKEYELVAVSGEVTPVR